MPVPGDILLSTAYFPPISWFAFLLRARNTHIEQMETFPKQTYRNRCDIMTASGKGKLIVPVSKPQGNHTITKDIEICYRESWREQHWKTLQSAYSSSPFFSYYADIIRPLFKSKEILLLKHNTAILQRITALLGIKPNLMFTDDFMKEPEGLLDMRSGLSSYNAGFQIKFDAYPQVFSHKFGFIPDLSILDLLFNLGPEAKGYLEMIAPEAS